MKGFGILLLASVAASQTFQLPRAPVNNPIVFKLPHAPVNGSTVVEPEPGATDFIDRFFGFERLHLICKGANQAAENASTPAEKVLIHDFMYLYCEGEGWKPQYNEYVQCADKLGNKTLRHCKKPVAAALELKADNGSPECMAQANHAECVLTDFGMSCGGRPATKFFSQVVIFFLERLVNKADQNICEDTIARIKTLIIYQQKMMWLAGQL
ncbi:unnamed protein product, partial [Mesorhabditis spiculigera]